MTKENIKISSIKYYLQAICDLKNTNLKYLISKTPYNYENISKKLKDNTIRYQELKDILQVIDYDLKIIDDKG